jgi:hypothetical protein
MNEIEAHNQELKEIEEADKNALNTFDQRYGEAMGEIDHLRTRLSDAEI